MSPRAAALVASPAAPYASATDPDAPAAISVERVMLGGRVGVHLEPAADASAVSRRLAVATLNRIEAWASRLTRFDEASDLCRLNASSDELVAVRPTLATVLDWGRTAESATDGIVNVALLDARLAAEVRPSDRSSDGPSGSTIAARRWSVERHPRATFVRRPAGLRFDLDGVAKGWLADRALDLLTQRPTPTLGQLRLAIVDADGDVAIELSPGASCAIAIEDPGHTDRAATTLILEADHDGRPTRYGVATSGTSNHAWRHGGQSTHHLIDPRTGRSAATDLVQATVIARTARHAEAFAKAAVILGSEAAEAALDRADILGAVLVTTDGRLLLTPGTTRFLA